MNRRTLLKCGMLSVGALSIVPVFPRAQAQEMGAIAVQSEISNNHGHAVNLTAGEALRLLRVSFNGAMTSLDIQGASGHPHTLELSHQELLNLFLLGQLEKSSSVDAGHAHLVLITMDDASA